MHSDTDTILSTSMARAGSWQTRKQDYSTMMAAIRSGHLGVAKRAFTSLTAGRTLSPISPLALLGKALQTGNAASVEQAARTLHQVRTGLCYRHLPRGEAPAPATRMTRARRTRRGHAISSFEQAAGV